MIFEEEFEQFEQDLVSDAPGTGARGSHAHGDVHGTNPVLVPGAVGELMDEAAVEAGFAHVDATEANQPGWVRRDLRVMFVLAVANVASTVSQTVMSWTDFYVVSLLPNPVPAQAGVSCGTMVFFTAFGLLLGSMVCTTTLVSQSLGVKRYRDCSSYGWQGVWISMLFGVIGFVVWPFLPQLYAWFGHDRDVQQMETAYTQIRMLSLGVCGAQVALSHYFIGIHRPWVDTWSAMAAAFLNGVLCYVMVLGHWGCPAMGVKGAGWATVIATSFRMVWLLISMCWGRTAEQFDARHTWGWNTEKIARLMRVGWPSGLQFVLDIGAWSAFQVWIIGMFGSLHMATTAVVWRYTELSFMPAVGIGLAVSTMVGRAIGEQKLHLAYRRAWLGNIVNMVYMGTMGVIFVVFGRALISVFSKDAAVISLGIELLVFVAIFQLSDAVAITYSNALRGAGDTLWPGLVGPAQAWVIMVGGGWVMARYYPELGSRGPWAFATLFVIVIGVTFWVRWRRAGWEKLDVIGRNSADDAMFGSPGA